MQKRREDLEKYLEKKILVFISDTKVLQDIYDLANTTYNIPRSISSDYITMRLPMSEASDFLLFCLTDIIEKTRDIKSVLKEYFTEQEIKFYSLSKFEVNKIKFPLVFKTVQISNNQWIGKINIQTMMQLRDAQLINYNVNAQRTMQRIVKGDQEIYRVTINHKAVNNIKELYRKGTYIPTPFTLNVPEDSVCDFYYDEDKSELIINNLDHFDISDGYHRYIAASEIYDIDSDFDYSMELRIVNWSDDKAKQFIWQEDQKTFMKKIDSESLNMNKAANIVAERLNESSKCNLQGMIARNGGLINLGDLATVIDAFYFKNNKENDKIIVINTVKELTEGFNLLTEYDTRYLKEKYTFKDLVLIVYLFVVFKDNKEKICDIIDEFINKSNQIDNRKFVSKKITKTLLTDLEKIEKEFK